MQTYMAAGVVNSGRHLSFTLAITCLQSQNPVQPGIECIWSQIFLESHLLTGCQRFKFLPGIVCRLLRAGFLPWILFGLILNSVQPGFKTSFTEIILKCHLLSSGQGFKVRPGVICRLLRAGFLPWILFGLILNFVQPGFKAFGAKIVLEFHLLGSC